MVRSTSERFSRSVCAPQAGANRSGQFALATAAAGLFATATLPTVAAKHEGNVMCQGVNACKGKGDCATATNACKGKGIMMMSAKDCKAKGGKYEMPKS